MAKITRFLTTSTIAVLVAMFALSFMPARSSANVYWTLYAGPSGPNEIYFDQYPTFTFYIHNDGAVGLDIWNFYFDFDWDTATHYALVGSTHATIAAGTDSTHYTQQVHIPLTAAAGTHNAYVYCTGKASSDLLNTPGSWTFPFTVDPVPTLVVPSTGANPNSGVAPLTVNFDSTPSGGLSPYSCSWTFGDGGTSTSATPSHVYDSAGTFTATVVVTDTETVSQVKTATSTITVTWPALSVTGTASTTTGSLSADFTCAPNGGDGVYSYAWNFGDKSTTSSNQNPTHQYSAAGTYTVTVTVSDTASHTAQWSKVITVSKSTNGGGTALSSSILLGGIIAVVIVVAIVVALVVMGRKKRAGGQGSMQPVQQQPGPPRNP